jgi:hypothetical protein
VRLGASSGIFYVWHVSGICDLHEFEDDDSHLTPVLISDLAAAATLSSVSLFRVPSSSLSPYSPQAECIGASFCSGRASKGGIPFSFKLYSDFGELIVAAIC